MAKEMTSELRHKDGTPMRKYNSPKLQAIEMENNKSVTAVEWLFEKLWDEPKDKFTWYALRQKAIEIEKEKTEISDEEIEKFAKSINPYPSTKQGSVDWENGFIRAIQWYREQLKQKL